MCFALTSPPVPRLGRAASVAGLPHSPRRPSRSLVTSIARAAVAPKYEFWPRLPLRVLAPQRVCAGAPHGREAARRSRRLYLTSSVSRFWQRPNLNFEQTVIVLVIGDRRHKLPLGADDRERFVLPPAKQRRRRCANNVKKSTPELLTFAN
jgi:hypothetical protein